MPWYHRWRRVLRVLSGLAFLRIFCFLILVTGGLSITNFLLLRRDYESSMTFSFKITIEPLNYSLGFLIQSLVLAILSGVIVLHELFALFWRPVFVILKRNGSRAMLHVIVGCLSVGFCAGIGFFAALYQLIVGGLWYALTALKNWNPGDVSSDESEAILAAPAYAFS
jgi:hypothetical protein